MAEPRMRLRQKGQQFSNPERVSLTFTVANQPSSTNG
jgi:hypothetical protein